jgi:hypothetical protein
MLQQVQISIDDNQMEKSVERNPCHAMLAMQDKSLHIQEIEPLHNGVQDALPQQMFHKLVLCDSLQALQLSGLQSQAAARKL